MFFRILVDRKTLNEADYQCAAVKSAQYDLDKLKNPSYLSIICICLDTHLLGTLGPPTYTTVLNLFIHFHAVLVVF